MRTIIKLFKIILTEFLIDNVVICCVLTYQSVSFSRIFLVARPTQTDWVLHQHWEDYSNLPGRTPLWFGYQ